MKDSELQNVLSYHLDCVEDARLEIEKLVKSSIHNEIELTASEQSIVLRYLEDIKSHRKWAEDALTRSVEPQRPILKRIFSKTTIK